MRHISETLLATCIDTTPSLWYVRVVPHIVSLLVATLLPTTAVQSGRTRAGQLIKIIERLKMQDEKSLAHHTGNLVGQQVEAAVIAGNVA